MPILLCIFILLGCTLSFASGFEQYFDRDNVQAGITGNESGTEESEDNLEGIDFVKICANSSMTEKQVAELIKNGADVNKVNTDGWTALHSAATHANDPKVIKCLVKNGLSVHARTVGGFTPLMLAALYNPNPEISKELVRLGSDITATKSGLVFVTDSNGVKKSLEKNVSDDEMSENEEKIWNEVDVLQMAVLNNSPQVVSFFLSKGKQLGYTEKKRRISLIGLAAAKNPKALSSLLKAGFSAEPNQKGRDCTYYDYGSFLFENSFIERSEEIHDSGCGIYFSSENVISYALRHNNDLETFRLLLKFKILIEDESILLTAIESKSSEDIIQLLVKAGAPVSTRTKNASVELPFGEYRNNVIDIIAKGKKGRH